MNSATMLYKFWPLLVLVILFSPSTSNAGDEVIVPQQTIRLFNGEDLSNFYTWLEDHHYDDPNRVFGVVDAIDGAPAIRISGEDWGGLITKQEYAEYHLVVEYRWGSVTWGKRKHRARDSGILLHAQGPDGNYRDQDFNSPFMRSVEYQIIEGGTGDIILLRGYSENRQLMTPELTTTVIEEHDDFYWSPQGKDRRIHGDRINWFDRDRDWKDELNFRGRNDIEKPIGKWNRLDAYMSRDTLIFMVNGVVVNKAQDLNLTKGKVFLQSEGAEIYFRRIELHPLPDVLPNSETKETSE